jgi:hypothetical protein
MGIGIAHLRHRRSTRNPPHEQLLVRLGAGGASSSFVHHLYVRHSSVICTSVIPPSFVRPSYIHRLSIVHLSIVHLSVVRPLFVRPSFVCRSYVCCSSVVSFVCCLLLFVRCHSTRDPPHEQWLVRLEAGGMSLCAVCPISAGGMWRVMRCIGCVPRRYPLQGSPGIPLCPPRPCRQPHIPFEWGGGGGFIYVGAHHW